MSSRRVVLLFGPPGAGKTTIARESGLTVYDRDDAEWKPHGETYFRQGIRQLAGNPQAQAVIIRSGATSSARRRSIGEAGATHAFLVLTDPATCHYRVGHRRREDRKYSQAAIDTWYAKLDRDDGIPAWPGDWAHARATPPMAFAPMPARERRRAPSKAGDPRGTRAWRRLREQVYEEEDYCWRCGLWVDKSLPRWHPMSKTADHLDAVALGYAGVPDRSRVKLAHWTCNSQRGTGVKASAATRAELIVGLHSI